MSWGQSTSIKECEVCGAEYEVRDTRTASRLCSNCNRYKRDIDMVKGDRQYSQLTEQDIENVKNRVARGRTVNRGFRFNIKQAEIEAQRGGQNGKK